MTASTNKPSIDAKFSSKRRRVSIDDDQLPVAKRGSPVVVHQSKDQARNNVRFLVLSDTHDLDLKDDPKAAFRLPAPEADVVLHCGDLTQHGDCSSIVAAMEVLGKIPAELKLVIAGNHEISLDRKYYLSQGGTEESHEYSLAAITGPVAKQNGVTFLQECTQKFTLRNGASFTVFASPYTPQFGESAFQYPTGEDRFNPPEITPKWAKNVSTPSSTIPPGVDIVMTHGPPKYILDQNDDGQSSGCEHLRNAIIRAEPRLHCFGHIHAGYGAQRIRFDKDEEGGVFSYPKEFVGKNQARRKGYSSLSPSTTEALKESGKEQCLMVNAAIECRDGEPVNSPWLVELELGRSDDGVGGL
ncbi:Metallo-dependent phosphatase-like protein [Phyllosticta citriasiana]|uniref:Metallo-dependent phosphatase-like protein n=1 Tax=Phyllosticta citriasiana TaxID=595635 RepID=A0ABR1KL35_9PEZI